LTDQVTLTPRGPNALKLVANVIGNSGPRALSDATVKIRGGKTKMMFPLERQEVSYAWDTDKKRWVFGDNAHLYGSNRAKLNKVVKEFLHPAPRGGSRRDGPLINYLTDCLFFECHLCGVDRNPEFGRAMVDAVNIVIAHQSNPSNPPIRNLAFSWCTGDLSLTDILGWLTRVKNLEEVTMVMHRHFDEERLDGEGPNCRFRDIREAEGAIAGGQLNGYAFSASIEEYNRFPVAPGEDELVPE
jgi:hypothetical protein